MKILKTALLILFLAAAAACTQPGTGDFERGEGSIEYTKYEPLADKPVGLYYYIPTKGDVRKMPVLFSIHGAGRNAGPQVDSWKYFAEERGFVVLAPEFTVENGYPLYHFGDMYEGEPPVLKSSEEWNFRIIEDIFDYFKEQTGNRSAVYDIFGHSGGGQFVHRFLMAIPEARVNTAVAANPGSWAFPYPDGIVGTDGETYGWPWSLLGTPFASKEHLARFLSLNMWVQIGTADNSTGSSSLPKEPPAAAEGANRYERARNFYAACVAAADEMGVPLNIRYAEVDSVAHSGIGMIYGKPKVDDPSDTADRGVNSAFDLIFNDK